MSRLSILWIVPPIAAGIAVAAWFVTQAPGPERVDTGPPAPAVRVAEVERRAIRPVARGWGDVRAAETWTAIAEVRGEVIERHPDLESGKLMAAGTTALEIDPADYELAVAQAEADLQALNAEAGQIEAEAENTDRILTLERERLAILESDLARIRELVAQGAAPQTRVDEAQRAVLAARRVVTELQNTATLVPSRRERIEAQIARTEAAFARARRDLGNTAVTLPFELRITSVGVERFQYVATGQTLLTGDGIERIEVVAHVPVPTFRRLLTSAVSPSDMLAAMRTGPTGLIDAELRLIGDAAQVWQGDVARIEAALDPRARTVPVVVSVADPYRGADPPLRLPLVPNMQVEVTLTGTAIQDAVTIPESALHGDLVHVLGEDDRLELRPVEISFRQDGLAVIAAGLEVGERIVLDDIAPAIPGMVLTPVEPAE